MIRTVTAIQQGSDGLFRRANHLARDAIIAVAAVLSKIGSQKPAK
ncbi:hypothetical protein DFAR_850002 [Desulfarculales bacterium]